MAQSMGKLYVEIAGNASKLVNEVGKANKSLGLLEKSAIRLQNTLIGIGSWQVINAIGNNITKYAEFDRALKSVEVISGATGDSLDALQKSTLQLGSATEFGAKKVAELQLQLARLGFSTSEIINSQKAIVQLSIATGEDLAQSAQIAGSTLRAFQLDASEMGRVTDVMAAALNNSALSVDTFGEAMKYVAPVAKSAGVSLEELSAMMSVLADAGFSASTMGTSLRRIITMLGKDGKPTVDRLRELSKAGLTLADANDEVGLYAQSALLQLSAMTPKVDELTKAYGNAIGATNTMATAMQDNLAVSIGKVRSAWDGWIYSLGKGEGTVNGFAKHIANLFTLMSMTAEEQEKLNIGGIEGALRGITAPLTTESTAEIAAALLDLRKKEVEELEKKVTIEEDNLKTGYKSVGIYGSVLANQEKIITATVKTKDELEKEAKELEKINKKREDAVKLALELSEIERGARIATLERKQAGPGKTPIQQLGTFSAGQFSTPLQAFDSQQIEAANHFGVAVDSIADKISRLNYEQSLMNAGIMKSSEQWMFWGDAISNVIDNVIAKNQDFAASLAETTARIIDSTKKEIAAYLAAGAAKAFSINPAAAGAIIAVGLSAISGLLKNFAKTSDVNTRATGSSASYRGDRSVEVYGKFEMSGRTAVALVRSGNNSNSITGG
jgi:hypothetical protein